MLDIPIRKRIDPLLNSMAGLIAKTGLSANSLTFTGFFCGLAGAVSLLFQAYWIALFFLALNRLCDGLDGALARRLNTHESGFGGYLDIVLDMIVYAAWPCAFAIGLHDPNSYMAICFLLVAYIGTATSFLALSSILSAKGVEADESKSLIFGRGLAEGTETAVYMALICLIPSAFIMLTIAYGLLCYATIIQRGYQAHSLLS